MSSEIASLYRSGAFGGWVGADPGVFDELAGDGRVTAFALPKLSEGPRRAMLYQTARKVLGHDVPNLAQAVGDCVSHAARHATEYLTCSEIASGLRAEWRPVFPPYYYGTGRIYVGGGRIHGDGSSGAWMAAAVQKYGTLFADEPGVPPYSGTVARQWGGSRRYLDPWVDKASAYPVKSAARVTTWDGLCTALTAGLPVTTASDVGYAMLPGPDGFHVQDDTWSHALCFIGVDETYKEPYAIILNSWGDVHGHLVDFTTGESLPVGVLRVRREDAEKHLAANDSYAYNNFEAYRKPGHNFHLI